MNGIISAFTGRLGGDAELKYTREATPVVSFSVAVDDHKAPEGTPAEWVRCSLFGDTAEDLAQRLPKGQEVYVEGRLRLNTWKGQDGQPRSGLNLTAWTVTPLGQIGRRRPAQSQPSYNRGAPRPLPEEASAWP